MKTASQTSTDNHTLLIQLGDSLLGIKQQQEGLGGQLTTHIKEQQIENQRLNTRIDDTQVQSRKGVEEIKDSLAQRGRISGGVILGFIGVTCSVLALIGGITQAYVSSRIENIIPLIEYNTRDVDRLREWIAEDLKGDQRELRTRRMSAEHLHQ